MILEVINILKLSSRSLVNRWHLLDPRSRSFMQADNDIQNTPALDCVAKDDHTHAHVSQFLSSLGRVNNPTPVLSDTCFSQPIRRERETLLAWNKSGPCLRNPNTWLICVCVSVCQRSPLPNLSTDWHTGEEGEIKGNYPISPGRETWPRRLSKFEEFQVIFALKIWSFFIK